MISQDQIMRECFEGERSRNCTYCAAHHTKNGRCCFGHRFEEHDQQCLGCPHVSACEPSTYAFLDAQPTVASPYQPNAAPRRILINRATGATSIPEQRIPVPGQPHLAGAPLIAPQVRTAQIAVQNPHDMGFWHQMSLHATWGAVEGMLEMLLRFFQLRRPG